MFGVVSPSRTARSVDPLFVIESPGWEKSYPAAVQEAATRALEGGKALLLPELRFPLWERESAFLCPETVSGAKNISYDPGSGKVGGTAVAGMSLDGLRALLGRFTQAARRLVESVCPAYRGHLVQGRASLRPVEAAGRVLSWRKDDTRLHVDSFPSMPTGGNRILRVFSNINPAGVPRVWRIGGPFADVAARFWARLRRPVWGSNLIRQALRLTKGRRTAYDHYMLQLHDAMKADPTYQSQGEQVTQHFPAGSTWIVYTDQVPHAAMSGVHLLEQTFYVPVESQRDPQTAPLRVLEDLAGRRLA